MDVYNLKKGSHDFIKLSNVADNNVVKKKLCIMN